MNFDELSEDELNQVLEELEEVNDESSRIYIPHPAQREFHSACHKIRALFGANRSGKSDAGVNEAKMHSTGQYPDWYPVEQRFSGPTMGRVVVTDYRVGCREVLEPKIKRWFAQEDIVKIDRTMGNISKVHVRHITGGISTFDVLTHEQDSNVFEGWSGHWAWFDEPPPRDKYIATLRGLVDFDGRIWITATPITEPWLHDEIVLNVQRKAWHKAVSIFDNPHLSRKAIEEFMVSLTPEEKEARIHGKFLHLTGRVYGEFDTNVHLLENLPKGHEEWPVYFVLDPADRRPHHAIWAKVDPMNRVWIFDELVYKGTIEATSKEIVVRERTKKIKTEDVIRILDPNKGRTPSAATGLKLIDEFAKHGVYFTANVNDDLALGHLSVKERLSFSKEKGIFPTIYFIRDTTRECVKQMLSYVWEDWRGRNASGRSEKEVPKDINKDMPDCVRYLCMSKPTWFNPRMRGDYGVPKLGFTGWGS